MKKHLLILACLLYFTTMAQRSYVEAGYINVVHVTGNTYQATVTLYANSNPYDTTSCYGATLRDTIRLYYGDGTSALLYRTNGIKYPSDTNPQGDTVCSCNSVNIYNGAAHTFPGAGTYHMWIDLIGLPYNIFNMPNSGGDDFYLMNTLIVDQYLGNNSSTSVLPNPLVCTYGCTNQCYYYNFNATVPNGDSVSYSLGAPLVLGGQIAPGYFIPPTAYIDPIKGTLSWCNPTTSGLYEFAVYLTTYSPKNIGGAKKQIAIDTTETLLYVTINSTCPTGIDEIKTSNAYDISPNPATNFAYLNSNYNGTKQVTLHDISGRELSKTELSGEQTEINISALARGMYFVRVIETLTGKSYTLKLIKN